MLKTGLIMDDDIARFGGVQKTTLGLYEYLEKNGFEVKIITCGKPLEKFLKRYQTVYFGDFIDIQVNGSPVALQLVFNEGKAIKKMLKEERFDIIHFQGIPNFLGQQVLRHSDSINVSSFYALAPEGLLFWLGKTVAPFFKFINSHFDAKIAISRPAKEFSQHFFPGDYELIPAGIDIALFSKGKPIPQFKDGKINILFIGRFDKRKGIPYLLSAYNDLKKNFPNCRLILVGSGKKKEQLVKQIEEEQIPDIVFAGAVSENKLRDYLKTADIFCSPALYGESFGVVLIEAMAAGLPLVTFDNSGYLSVLPQHQLPFAVKNESITALSQALFTLASFPQLRYELSERNLKEAQKYSWEFVGPKIVNVYKRAIEQGKRPKRSHFDIFDKMGELLNTERLFNKYLFPPN